MMPDIRVVEVSGSPREMGRQHGERFRRDIKILAKERVVLSSNKNWTGYELPRPDVLALGEACLPWHQEYAPELMEELRGIGDATGVGLTELVILNGFTDFIDVVFNHRAAAVPARPAHPAADNCTAFIVSPQATAEGRGFFGQTWDMHATATPFVILLHGKPAGGLRFLTLTLIGCVGMIGMNEAGIAVGINNLMARDGRPGVTWPFVVRKILMQDNLDDALACITKARLAGAHNYLLADATGRGFNIEAMSSRLHVQEVTSGSLVHTNHCLFTGNLPVERERLPESRRNSELRLNRAEQLLKPGQITLNDLLALTRDHGKNGGVCAHAVAPFFVESCSAAVMRPATREMWAVWGLPCQNEYRHFTVKRR
ncbi:MAG: hypothetical protein D6768_13385 [Chloroflexi bacterium]|nr:MAG: hypothetical protein D6768_13385 [Chloroflexota bacterium]